MERNVPDGGLQAWLKVCAYWLTSAGTLGLHYIFSLLFVALLDEFDTGRTQLSAVGGLSVSLLELAAPLTGWMVATFGERKVCLLAACMSSCGLVLTAHVSAVWQLFLTFGIIVGLGTSFGLYSGIILLGKWFDKQLSLASAIGNLGAMVGSFFLPLVWSHLQDSIGWRNTLYVISLVDFLVLVTAGLMFVPPEQPSVPKSHVAVQQQTQQQHQCAAEPVVIPAARVEIKTDSPGTAEQREGHTHDQISDVAPSHYKATRSTSANHIPYSKVVRNRDVQRIALTILFYGMATWVPVVHVVRFGLDQGFSEEKSERLLLFFAIGSLTLRVPVNFMADRLGRHRVFASAATVYSVADLLLPVVASKYELICAHSFLAGGLTGSLNSLMPTLTYGSVENTVQEKSVTVTCGCLGPGVFLGPMFAGKLYDMTASYTISYSLAGACLLAAALTIISPWTSKLSHSERNFSLDSAGQVNDRL